jgi:hypothetical protein
MRAVPLVAVILAASSNAALEAQIAMKTDKAIRRKSYQPVTIFFGRRTRRSTLADLILFIVVVLYASLQVLVLGIGFLLLASLWLIYHQIFPSGVDLTHLEKISRSL